MGQRTQKPKDSKWQENAVANNKFTKIEGINIPFASARLLWRTKQTHREKDELDLHFLKTKLGMSEA